MLLIVGEAIVAYQRDLGAGGTDTGQAFTGPWASGSPAIAAYVAAGLGVDTRFVGGVGADERGQVMRRAFERTGVGLEGLRVVSGLRTASARITYRGDAHREFDFDVRGTAALRRTRGRPRHAAGARGLGAPVRLGPGLRRSAGLDRAGRLRPGAARRGAYLRRPERTPGGARRGRADGARRGHRPRRRPAAERGGDGGARAGPRPHRRIRHDGVHDLRARRRRSARAGSTTRLDAVPVEVVDADGAGDTFAAAFIAASIAGASPVAAAGAGVRVAAHVIGVEGPMTADLDPGLLDGPAPVRR